MSVEVLKKKISTYRGPGGRVRINDDELLMEILREWENWCGPSSGFYSAIGVSQKGFASIIGKAKKLKREGRFPVEEFTEVKVDGSTSIAPGKTSKDGIFVKWKRDKVIRFSQVDQLIEFLDKTERKAS